MHPCLIQNAYRERRVRRRLKCKVRATWPSRIWFNRHHRLCTAHVRHQSNGQRQSATHRPAAVDCRALLPLNARRKEAPGRPCSVRRTCPCQTRCWQGLFISNSRPFKPPLPAGFYRRSRDRLSAVPGPWRAIWSQPAALRWGFPANAGPLTIPSGGFSAGVSCRSC